MLNQITNLGLVFEKQLKKAVKLYIATGMMNDYGIELLRQLPDSSEIKLQLGIDLPTPPSVFSHLLNQTKIDFRVFNKKNQKFHPKVYLMQTDDIWRAYIGSSNFTKGGLSSNMEMNIAVDDEAIIDDLRKWFNNVYKKGDKIDQKWLDGYQENWETIKENENCKKQMLDDFKEKYKKINSNDPLLAYDFEGQFFQYEHYNAFSGNKPTRSIPEILKEREAVKHKLEDLNLLLKPLIKSKGWPLEEHYERRNIISQIKHGEYTKKQFRAAWLSYNQPKKEIYQLKKNFIVNQTPEFLMRFQVLINYNVIEIRVTVGKDESGGWREREWIRELIDQQNTPKLSEFKSLIVNLPDGFHIHVGGKEVKTNSFKTLKKFIEFLMLDDIEKHYFSFGTRFAPDAVEVSKDHIVSTIMKNFTLLFPLYNFLKRPIA